MLTAFDDDRTRVAQQLAAVGAQPAAGTMLLEGIASAARVLRATGAPFSAIVVISNTAKDDTRNAQRDLLATVLQSGAFVHVVANRSGADPAKLRLTEPLRGLAEQTHGQFTTIYAALSYQVALERLADRLAAELMVEYLVPPGSSASDVKLGVNLPGARVNGLGAR